MSERYDESGERGEQPMGKGSHCDVGSFVLLMKKAKAPAYQQSRCDILHSYTNTLIHTDTNTARLTLTKLLTKRNWSKEATLALPLPLPLTDLYICYSY